MSSVIGRNHGKNTCNKNGFIWFPKFFTRKSRCPRLSIFKVKRAF